MSMDPPKKRGISPMPNELDQEQDDWIGPMPSKAAVVPLKKRKILEFEQVYLDAQPSSDAYERSYMHKEPISFVYMTKTEFLITASSDGHLKFWKVSTSLKKCETG